MRAGLARPRLSAESRLDGCRLPRRFNHWWTAHLVGIGECGSTAAAATEIVQIGGANTSANWQFICERVVGGNDVR